MTRSSHRWRQKPGSFNAQNTADLFKSDNRWGIPQLAHTPVSHIPQWLVPYRTQIRTEGSLGDGAVHFFLDDYRFESVWSHPHKALRALQKYTTVLTPDFSLYCDWPLALQLWNTYRSRWCGRFWQQQGLTVIPTMSWSHCASYAFCFSGVPRHAVVAVSTVGVRFDDARQTALFIAGFAELMRRVAPAAVLCYGTLPPNWQPPTAVFCYPTRWTGVRQARRAARHAKAGGSSGWTR